MKKLQFCFVVTILIVYSSLYKVQAQSNSLPTSGRVGIGTTAPLAPLDVRTSESAGIPAAIINGTFAEYSREVEENRPFVIRRNVSSGEAIYSFVQDAEAIWEYRNDEGSNRMVFRMVNTDTESGGGANANRNEVLILHGNGAGGGISVGTSILPFGYRLSVDGKILAEELQIKQSQSWPDYVFEKDYKLISLSDLEAFIQENKHLPEIPSEKEVKSDGISVGEMNAKLLQKVEELTLYLIQQNKDLEQQRTLNKELMTQQELVIKILKEQAADIQTLKEKIQNEAEINN